MKKVGLIYNFKTNKTAKVADKITKAAGKLELEPVNILDLTEEQFAGFDNMIIGVATWFDGELPNYWDEMVPAIEEMDLTGKKVALFGLGDQKSYSENFADGIGLLGNLLESKGAKLIGFTSTEGYDYEGSLAERGDQFMGLALDYENQGKQIDAKVKDWVAQIEKEF